MNTFKKACENLLRNWRINTATIITIAILLTLFYGLQAIRLKAQNTIESIEQKFSITLYLKDTADAFEISKLITSLEQRNDVKKPVIYTSKEEAWQLLSKTFSLDNELLKKYRFSLPASLTITPQKLSDTPVISAFLETHAKNLIRETSTSKIKQKNVTDQMISFITTIEDATTRAITVFMLFFGIGAAVLLSTAIHIAITTHKREIGIMKLVGASYKTITMPFLLEGILISAVAFFLHIILLIILNLSFEISETNLNLLIGEFLIITILSAMVSQVTAFSLIRRKSIF